MISSFSGSPAWSLPNAIMMKPSLFL